MSNGYELVIPFLPVQSEGGPYDDLAYTAGFEMGALYARLEAETSPGPIGITVHHENQQQADLIAMRHGYTTEFKGKTVHGWVSLLLKREATI